MYHRQSGGTEATYKPANSTNTSEEAATTIDWGSLDAEGVTHRTLHVKPLFIYCATWLHKYAFITFFFVVPEAEAPAISWEGGDAPSEINWGDFDAQLDEAEAAIEVVGEAEATVPAAESDNKDTEKAEKDLNQTILEDMELRTKVLGSLVELQAFLKVRNDTPYPDSICRPLFSVSQIWPN